MLLIRRWSILNAKLSTWREGYVELEADYRSYGSPAITHKRAEHLALKPIDRINL